MKRRAHNLKNLFRNRIFVMVGDQTGQPAAITWAIVTRFTILAVRIRSSP